MRTQTLPAGPVSNVSQPKSSYEAYNQTLEEMEKLELDGDKLARAKGLVTPLFDEDPLRIISSTNLIVECGEFNFAVCRRGY